MWSFDFKNYLFCNFPAGLKKHLIKKKSTHANNYSNTNGLTNINKNKIETEMDVLPALQPHLT